MTQAPSPKEALEQLVDALEMDYPERPTRNALPPSALTFVMISQAKDALATLSPPAGERREAIAREPAAWRFRYEMKEGAWGKWTVQKNKPNWYSLTKRT